MSLDNTFSLEDFFNAETANYDHLHLPSENTVKVKLTRDETVVVLKAYDYGVSQLNNEEADRLNAVIAKLKDTIHP